MSYRSVAQGRREQRPLLPGEQCCVQEEGGWGGAFPDTPVSPLVLKPDDSHPGKGGLQPLEGTEATEYMPDAVPPRHRTRYSLDPRVIKRTEVRAGPMEAWSRARCVTEAQSSCSAWKRPLTASTLTSVCPS